MLNKLICFLVGHILLSEYHFIGKDNQIWMGKKWNDRCSRCGKEL